MPRLVEFVLIALSLSVSDCLSRHAVIEDKLKTYSRVVLPNVDTDDPVEVDVKVIIHSMDSISEATMDYSVTIYLRQWWSDHRLAYAESDGREPIELDVDTMDFLWVPDVFFINEKRGTFHDITVPNELMHIYRNGSIFHSVRLSLTLSCNMDLRKYPLDSQVCPLIIGSYSYTSDRVVLNWVQDNSVACENDLQLPHFQITGITSEKCKQNYGIAGDFTCLRADIFMKRNIGFYLIQIYIPSLLIVVLSWVSFWLNIDAVPARISLGVLTVLTITTQNSGLNDAMPKVSYIKALDVWMAMCLAFVFGALLEFSIVNVYSRGEITKMNVDFRRTIRSLRSRDSGRQDDKNSDQNSEVDTKIKPIRDAEDSRQRLDYIDRRRAMDVDKFARKAFPLSFLTMNLIYWLVYTLWES